MAAEGPRREVVVARHGQLEEDSELEACVHVPERLREGEEEEEESEEGGDEEEVEGDDGQGEAEDLGNRLPEGQTSARLATDGSEGVEGDFEHGGAEQADQVEIREQTVAGRDPHVLQAVLAQRIAQFRVGGDSNFPDECTVFRVSWDEDELADSKKKKKKKKDKKTKKVEKNKKSEKEKPPPVKEEKKEATEASETSSSRCSEPMVFMEPANSSKKTEKLEKSGKEAKKKSKSISGSGSDEVLAAQAFDYRGV